MAKTQKIPSSPTLNKTKSGAGLNSNGMKKNKPLRKEARAGLHFPIAKVAKFLSKHSLHTERVGQSAAVWAAAVTEYVARELIEAASRSVNELGRKKRIHPRDVTLAIREDVDLARLFGGVRVLVGDRLRLCAEDVEAKTDTKYKSATTTTPEAADAAAKDESTA